MTLILDEVRDSMYSIVGRICYDDISDLDAEWTALADAIKRLSFTRAVSFRTTKKNEGVLAAALEDINREYPVNIDGLIKLVREMEDLSRAGSTSGLSEEKGAHLKGCAERFAKDFPKFMTQWLGGFIQQ